MASAGTTWPAVPPAAITIVGGRLRSSPSRDGLTARSGSVPPCATLSSSPIEHSSTISDVEPEEMNGSGTPVSGARPRTV